MNSHEKAQKDTKKKWQLLFSDEIKGFNEWGTTPTLALSVNLIK
jgi:hypothetical protein